MRGLIIIGASGHGKVCADIARLNGYEEIHFLDDDENLSQCGRYKVIGKTNEAEDIDGDVIVAIGNSSIRKRFCQIYENRLVTLIHPNAVIAEDVKIDTGTVVMAGAVINTGTYIGKGCIVNTSSSIDHDCLVADYVHVAVGVHLAGTVVVGQSTWIGAGTVVSNNVNICGGCMIGAGSVVVRNIDEPGTYVGTPAKSIGISK